MANTKVICKTNEGISRKLTVNQSINFLLTYAEIKLPDRNNSFDECIGNKAEQKYS